MDGSGHSERRPSGYTLRQSDAAHEVCIANIRTKTVVTEVTLDVDKPTIALFPNRFIQPTANACCFSAKPM